jgi:AcrR family transcriptional regulator
VGTETASDPRVAVTGKLRRTSGRLRYPDRPDEILGAACAAIVERGFSETRVGDIARIAGTSTGTIHYYFDSKDAVLVAALRWATERLFESMEAASEPSATVRLARLLELSIPSPRREEYVLWIEMWTLVLRDPDRLPEVEDLSRRWRTLFFDIVALGTAVGEFAPVAEPEIVAERLIAIVDGLGFETVIGYDWATAERMRALLVAFAAEQLSLNGEELAAMAELER